MLEDKDDSPLVIDVREPQEYEQGHIPGSVLLPLGQLELGHSSLQKGKKIVTYCRSGKRSYLAATMLCQMGYTGVMSLEKGILGWEYQLLKGPLRDTLTPEETASIRDIFKSALSKENRKCQFYRRVLELPRFEELKSLLEDLASWEEGHRATLYREYVGWSEKQHAPVKSLEEMTGASAEAVKDSSSLEGISQPVELLEAALEQEYEAYHFYKVSAEMMQDEKFRSLLLDLSFAERTHASYLLKLIPRYAVS